MADLLGVNPIAFDAASGRRDSAGAPGPHEHLPDLLRSHLTAGAPRASLAPRVEYAPCRIRGGRAERPSGIRPCSPSTTACLEPHPRGALPRDRPGPPARRAV